MWPQFNTSLLMVDNLECIHSDNPYMFKFVLPEPLRRVGAVRLISMTMHYEFVAVLVTIEELNARFPVFVDKSLDSPLLLAPHMVYEHRFKGHPLDHLSALTIKIMGEDRPKPDTSIPQKNRVTMLFSVEHDCIVDGNASSAENSPHTRTWLLVSNRHTYTYNPYTFKWPGPPDGPLHNIQRIALKAFVMSMYATHEPFVNINIPELHIRDWPIPYTCDTIGTHYPYVLMHRSPDYEVTFYPPKSTLNSLSIDIVQGNNKPIDWQEKHSPLVFMLLEVDHQPAPAGTLKQYLPQPEVSRLLFIDNYNARTPFAFKYELDEPCRNVARIVLQQLACPHVAVEGVTMLKLHIHNLDIHWIIPYGRWFHRPQTNVLAIDEALHAIQLTPVRTFGCLELELEFLNPSTGTFAKLVPHPDACLTVCMALRVEYAMP